MTHICVSELNIIVSDNGPSPGRRQVITWINAAILMIIDSKQFQFAYLPNDIINFVWGILYLTAKNYPSPCSHKTVPSRYNMANFLKNTSWTLELLTNKSLRVEFCWVLSLVYVLNLCRMVVAIYDMLSHIIHRHPWYSSNVKITCSVFLEDTVGQNNDTYYMCSGKVANA